MDHDWRPSILAQVKDRAFPIGANRTLISLYGNPGFAGDVVDFLTSEGFEAQVVRDCSESVVDEYGRLLPGYGNVALTIPQEVEVDA